MGSNVTATYVVGGGGGGGNAEKIVAANEQTPWKNFVRMAPLELAEEGDGRTLYGRVVPYGVVAVVADPPTFTPYRESFAPGAFNAQLQAANRIDVLLNYEHRQGIADVVGRGVALEDHSDGLYGTFRVLTHADGDKALELYHAGVLCGLSTEFSVRKSRTVDGVVQRVDARIGNVALCRDFNANTDGPKAAYKGAEVLAVRTDAQQPEIVVASAVPPLDTDRLAAIGIAPLPVLGVARKPWNDNRSRFTDEEWHRSCLLEDALPVLEPDGFVNVNALASVAGKLRHAPVSGSEKAAGARKLLRLYRMAELTPPDSITKIATQ